MASRNFLVKGKFKNSATENKGIVGEKAEQEHRIEEWKGEKSEQEIPGCSSLESRSEVVKDPEAENSMMGADTPEII